MAFKKPIRKLNALRAVHTVEQLRQREVQRLREETSSIKSEVRQRTISYVIASLGLVAGLAWNDAIKSAIEYWFPLDPKSITAKFVYTIIITLVVIILTTYLVKLLGGEASGSKQNRGEK